MNKELHNKIVKLVDKKSKAYSSYVAFANDFNKQTAVSRHCSMVLDLIVVGRDPDRIKRVLLFSDSKYETLQNELYDALKCFRPKHKLFSHLLNR